MILSMLYDINFIIGLLITLLLVAIVSFYFTQRIEEQNEKISAMSMVVRAMAEELGYFRNNMLMSDSKRTTRDNEIHSQVNVQENESDLIAGGSISSSENKHKQEDIYTIDLAKLGGINEINLIPVSDCETESESEDETDSESESGSESGSDSDYNSESEDDEGLIKAGNIKSIKINMDNSVLRVGNEIDTFEVIECIDTVEDIEDIEDSIQDISASVAEDIDGYNEELKEIKEENTLNISEIIGSLNEDNSLDMGIDKGLLKSINISLESETEKAYSLDYKQLPLDKLRAIVQEKKLCADASKLKKKDLFKLLNV